MYERPSDRVYLHRNRPSSSARKLARATGYRITKLEGSKYRPSDSTWVVNWGDSLGPSTRRVLNSAGAVLTAVDKKLCLDLLRSTEGVRVPRELSFSEAEERLKDGKQVVARALLRASGGRGLAIVSPESAGSCPKRVDGLPVRAYYAYIPKRSEYRVHCANGIGIFHIQEKRIRRDHDEVEYQVRNAENGWIYAINDVRWPCDDVLEQAWRGFCATDLDFAGVDVIWNEGGKKAWVLELNTAPGLEGTTLERYADILPRIIEIREEKYAQ